MAIFRACAVVGAACCAPGLAQLQPSAASDAAEAAEACSTESCTQDVFMLQTAARLPASEHFEEQSDEEMELWPFTPMLVAGKRAAYRSAIKLFSFALDQAEGMINGVANSTEASVLHIEKMLDDPALKGGNQMIEHNIQKAFRNFLGEWENLLYYAKKCKGLGMRNIERVLGPGDSQLHQHARQHLTELTDDIIDNISTFLSEIRQAQADIEKLQDQPTREDRAKVLKEAQSSLARSVEAAKGFKAVISSSLDYAVAELTRGVDLGIIALTEGEAQVVDGTAAQLQSFGARAGELVERTQEHPTSFMKLLEKVFGR